MEECDGAGAGVVERGRRAGGNGGVDEGFAVTEDAFGVGAVEGDACEELGRHAAAPAGVELAAQCARPGRLWFTQLSEQFAFLPDPLETSFVADAAGAEFVVEHERAGVDVADRVDQAHHPTGAAEVEPGQRFAEG